MDVGIQMIFSTYGWPGMSDREAWQEEIRLARLADELGFDVIWSVEHHFFDYSFCPDNTQLLSYLAPLCTHADLGTAAIILPWNDPLRVAEKVSVLDLLSNGRVRLGLGRGLARREFAAFRGTMDDFARTVRRSLGDDPGGIAHRLHRGTRQILSAAADRDPAATGTQFRGPHLRSRLQRGLDRGGRAAEGAHADVRRPAVAAAPAGDRAVSRSV